MIDSVAIPIVFCAIWIPFAAAAKNAWIEVFVEGMDSNTWTSKVVTEVTFACNQLVPAGSAALGYLCSELTI